MRLKTADTPLNLAGGIPNCMRHLLVQAVAVWLGCKSTGILDCGPERMENCILAFRLRVVPLDRVVDELKIHGSLPKPGCQQHLGTRCARCHVRETFSTM